jgi:hypothetical protein
MGLPDMGLPDDIEASHLHFSSHPILPKLVIDGD